VAASRLEQLLRHAPDEAVAGLADLAAAWLQVAYAQPARDPKPSRQQVELARLLAARMGPALAGRSASAPGLAIRFRRIFRRLAGFSVSVNRDFARPEVDALLASPDRATWTGQRDHAQLLLAVQTGLRVSELASLRCRDVELGSGAHVCCHGKGRKERCTPLTKETGRVLRVWMRTHHGQPTDPLFPSRGSNRRRSGQVDIARPTRSSRSCRGCDYVAELRPPSTSSARQPGVPQHNRGRDKSTGDRLRHHGLVR